MRRPVHPSASYVFPRSGVGLGSTAPWHVNHRRKVMHASAKIMHGVGSGSEEKKAKLSSPSSIAFKKSNRSNDQGAPRIEQNSI